MGRKIRKVIEDDKPTGNPYVVLWSDDQKNWTIEMGRATYSDVTFGYGIDYGRSNPLTYADSPAAAIKGLLAPAGRVYRVLDPENGDTHEFIVEQKATA